MNWQKIVIPLVGVAFIASAWYSFGWQGVAFAVTAMLMWVLLHFTRLMHVLKRAADNPVGYVASAVMLNVKLRRGHTLLHVVALTRALGQQLSPSDTQPEIFRWTDGGGSHVTCEFRGGKLVKWDLVRPPEGQPGSAEVPSAAP